MPNHLSSIPAAIRDRVSVPAKPHVWTPDDFADLGPVSYTHLDVYKRQMLVLKYLQMKSAFSWSLSTLAALLRPVRSLETAHELAAPHG